MSKNKYTKLGYIPELGQYLLKHNKDGTLSLWRQSKIATAQPTTILGGVELEYVRDVRCAFRVGDNPYNRNNAFNDIGRIFIDASPINALTQEVR